MRYGEAFSKLGYRLEVPRQDWTAEKATGVCITLWRSEIDWASMAMDSRLHGSPIELWRNKPGNHKRIRHATRAIQEFGGWVDAVVVSGASGEGVDDATPWNAKERDGYVWRITFLDEVLGHIRLEAMKR